jgi:hypothetical protein
MSSAEDVTMEEPPAKRLKSEAAPARTCQFCSSKKHVAVGCDFSACKKCCLARPGVCSAHPKGTREMLVAIQTASIEA